MTGGGWRRAAAIAAGAAILAGAAAAAAWSRGRVVPEWSIAFERYRQESPCGGSRVSHLATLYLRPTYREKDSASVAFVRVRVDGRDAAQAEIAKEEYGWPSIFGKARFAERRREMCRLGSCTFGLSFYWPQYKIPPGVHSVSSQVLDASGKVLREDDYGQVELLTAEDAKAQTYEGVELERGQDGVLAGRVASHPGGGLAMLQWRDDGGYHESEVQAKSAGPVELRGRIEGTLRYAGFLSYHMGRSSGHRRWEDKVEIQDDSEPFYACPPKTP